MGSSELSPALREHLAVTYDLQRPLGEGGMGVVWLGRDRLLDRDVAIKVLRRDSSGDQDTARRFLQEARLAARLQHPGIVPLLTFGEVGDERFYVMPFVRGQTLAERIARGPVPEAELRRIVTEIADALTYVHARGIVHRDVKPANILLDADSGCAVLTDFGIARLRDATSVTSTGLVVGTPRYLSPEQASGGLDVVDGRADIYALGLVAWEAATGSAPFGDVSANELLARKLVGTLDDPRIRRPQLSADFASAILRASAALPEERFESASLFARAVRLGGDGDGEPEELRPFNGVLSNFAAMGVAISAVMTASMVGSGGSEPLSFRIYLGLGVGFVSAAMMGIARMFALRREHAPQRLWPELIRRAFRPPAWWPFWWPAPARHFYLADHLPTGVSKAMKWQMGTLSIALALGIAYQAPILVMGFASESVLETAQFGAMLGRFRLVFLGAPFVMIGLLAIGVAPMIRYHWRWRRAKLDARQLQRLFATPYSPIVLQNPVFARIHELEQSRATPQDLPALRVAIDEAVGRARGAGWDVTSVSTVVNQLQALEAGWADGERTLAAEFDAAESARAREQLARLRHVQAPSPAQRQMQDLLESQLRLMAESEVALQALRERRARAIALAQRLHQQLRALPAPSAAGDASQGIRTIADDLARLLGDHTAP